MNDDEKKEVNTKKKGKVKIILVLLLVLVLVTAAGIAFHFIQQGANYVATDNARVTTTLVTITPTVTGILEMYTIYEGRYVNENEVIGWVEHIETFRSPFDGLVVRSFASQNQIVTPAEPLAVIADINNLHIQANIEETYINRIQRGQSVTVTIDAFGNRQFTGYVSEIGRVTDSEISGTALFFNTGGNFTKVTQLIPVKINLLDDINLSNLIGLNARVRISLTAPIMDFASKAVEQDSIPSNTITDVQGKSIYTTLGFIVEHINVKASDIVSAGQVLCVLDAAELANEVKIAEASLRMAQVNLALTEHNITTRRALFQTGAMPRDEMRQLEFAQQAATASVLQAQAMLDAAHTALERSIIRSPINGIVTTVFAREGAIAMGLLFVIEETDEY